MVQSLYMMLKRSQFLHVPRMFQTNREEAVKHIDLVLHGISVCASGPRADDSVAGDPLRGADTRSLEVGRLAVEIVGRGPIGNTSIVQDGVSSSSGLDDLRGWSMAQCHLDKVRHICWA